MSKTIQSVDFNSIVKDIESFYTDNAVEAWCPWVGTTVKYKPLSVQQIREFIELQVKAQSNNDEVLAAFDLLDGMNNVLTSNALGEGDVLKTLTVLDRDAVIIQLRAFTKGVYELYDDHNELVEIDLPQVCQSIQNQTPPKKLLSRTETTRLNGGSIVVDLELPTLHRDIVVNKHFRNKVKAKLKKAKSADKHLDKLLGEMYFIELCKYINALTIDKSGTETVIRFDDVTTLNQSLQLLEKLPSNIVGLISKYIADVKKYRDSVISYTDSQGQLAPLEVDANIFTGI